MNNQSELLLLDLVEWVAKEPRPYSQIMAIWGAPSARLHAWKLAIDRGLVVRRRIDGRGVLVRATKSGQELLTKNGRFNWDREPFIPV